MKQNEAEKVEIEPKSQDSFSKQNKLYYATFKNQTHWNYDTISAKKEEKLVFFVREPHYATSKKEQLQQMV